MRTFAEMKSRFLTGFNEQLFGYRAGHRAQRLIAGNRSMLAFPRGLIVS